MGRPNNGPKLERRDNGFYYILQTKDGKSKPKSTGTKDQSIAQQIFGKFLMGLGNEQSQTGERRTIQWCIDFYDNTHLKLKVVAEGATASRRVLARMAKFFGPDTYVDELNQTKMTGYWSARLTQLNGKGGFINRATVRQDLITFKTALNFCVKKKELDSRVVPPIDYPEPNTPRQRYLTPEEMDKLFREARGVRPMLPPLYLLIIIAATTGRRRRAIELLQWKYVDFATGLIDFVGGRPQKKKMRGVVPISKFLLPILEQAYRERKTDYVLFKPTRRSRAVRVLCDRLGLPDVSCHTLRHTFGTWLAAQPQFSLLHIAQAMDCSEKTASRNYIHLANSQKRTTLEAVMPEGMEAHTTPPPPSQERKQAKKRPARIVGKQQENSPIISQNVENSVQQWPKVATI